MNLPIESLIFSELNQKIPELLHKQDKHYRLIFYQLNTSNCFQTGQQGLNNLPDEIGV